MIIIYYSTTKQQKCKSIYKIICAAVWQRNGKEIAKIQQIGGKDLVKICNDDDLIEIFLNGKQGFNTEITDYLIENFFSDYSLDDYLNIINQLKDWDNIVKDKQYPARKWW